MTSQRDRVLGYFHEAGFSMVRVAGAQILEDARAAALTAAAEGHLADMAWMTPEWLQRATDPGVFLPGARSVIVCALANHTPDPGAPGDIGVPRGRIARYARGRDYHRTFESRLRRVVRRLRSEEGAAARATVDYGPLLERPLAAAAGLGWTGKSSMLLVPGLGPWVMLGAVATDLELDPDMPLQKSCGSCTRCIVACPTGAISADGGVVDSRLCISYHTIENRGAIPRELRSKFGDWVFGCDDCLDACPVGASSFESDADFAPVALDDALPDLAQILALDEAQFAERFRGKAVRRAGRDGLVRNACVALGNSGSEADLALLDGPLADRSPVVRGHAAWAAGEIGARTDSRRATAMLERRLEIEHDATVREELLAALAAIEGAHHDPAREATVAP